MRLGHVAALIVSNQDDAVFRLTEDARNDALHPRLKFKHSNAARRRGRINHQCVGDIVENSMCRLGRDVTMVTRYGGNLDSEGLNVLG